MFAPRAVKGDIVKRLAFGQPDAEHAFGCIGSAQHRSAVSQLMDYLALEEVDQGAADGIVGRDANVFGQVGGCARDHPVGSQRQQETDRLDCAE
jgi:hypothetical protein